MSRLMSNVFAKFNIFFSDFFLSEQLNFVHYVNVWLGLISHSGRIADTHC